MIRLSDVIRDFTSCGWNPVLSYKGTTYLCPDPHYDELVRTFSPALMKHHGPPLLMGGLALLDRVTLEAGKPPARLSEILVASCHSANFVSLRRPPIYDQSTAKSWISTIASVVREMPNTFDEYYRQVQAGVEIDGFPLSRFIMGKPARATGGPRRVEP